MDAHVELDRGRPELHQLMATIQYTPPPTIREFIKDYRSAELFYSWIVGPVGSGKTTGIFFKLVYMAKLQDKGPDGVRRSRAVVVRNTLPQLRDTTLSSWNYWFKDGQAGKWHATDWKFVLKFDDVECEVLFRPLDRPEDVARVLSLEVTFAIIDEFVEIPKQIVEALSARCGRYPSAIMGGATNWGMWGSSNPSTEDNWWFEHLHDATIHVQPGEDLDAAVAKDALLGAAARNARYFLQPPGLLSDGTSNPDAENVENLPGGPAYYTNQAKGKSEAWIKQFLETQWGYSISGKPVVPTFKPELHVAKAALNYNPNLPLIGGFDPGLGGSAMIFGQEDLDGRLLVLGELVQTGYGTTRFISEKLKPYLKRRFPLLDMSNFIIAPDPAAANRAQNDEKTAVDILKKHFNVKVESNNRLPLRLDAIEHFTTRLVDGKPALLVDAKECPVLLRALKGGWRYALDKNENLKADAAPEKNPYSHPGDAFGYLARYYHRQAGKDARYMAAGVKPFVPPRSFSGRAYHVR
jgi:hypothetical protein